MTNDTNSPPIPSAWSAYQPILAGLARVVLVALGAAGITWANAVTASQSDMVVGAIMIAAAACWSAWQKVQSDRANVASSIASAQASAAASAYACSPVPVVVTDAKP